jgi:hypothetical protein
VRERRSSLPLSKRARIEIYLPDRKKASYRRLHRAFEQEFLNTFGGCTIIKDIKGLYLDSDGKQDIDRIDLIYADTPFDFDKNLKALSRYTDEIRKAAVEATEEESILVVVHAIYHSL